MAVRHFRWARMNEGIYIATTATLRLEVMGNSPHPTSGAYYWQIEDKKSGAIIAEGRTAALDSALAAAENRAVVAAASS